MQTGRVISAKMQKTVVVAVDRFEMHPVYRKAVRRITKLYAHDPKSECKPGDVVLLQQVRPLSKSKRWLVKQVVAKASVAQIGEAGEEAGVEPAGGPQ
jgi:small subunit ribosomal protein S17